MAAAGSRTRVLIIDSDPLVRNVLEVAISALGDYELATARDGDTGLAMIQSFRPHCVFVDLLGPGTDGFTLLTRLGNGAGRPERVIVSGGIMDSSIMPQLYRLGADAVLPRPFRIGDLAQALGHRDQNASLQLVAYLN